MFMPITYDILTSLHEMFGGNNIPTRQATLKAVMNNKMSKGTPIKDHMICMIELFNEIKILGVKIDGKT